MGKNGEIDDDHPLLTARHVDDLTEAVKTLNMNIVHLTSVQQKQVEATIKFTALLREGMVLMEKIEKRRRK